jgi:hypothetical protein
VLRPPPGGRARSSGAWCADQSAASRDGPGKVGVVADETMSGGFLLASMQQCLQMVTETWAGRCEWLCSPTQLHVELLDGADEWGGNQRAGHAGRGTTNERGQHRRGGRDIHRAPNDRWGYHVVLEVHVEDEQRDDHNEHDRALCQRQKAEKHTPEESADLG